MEIQKLFETIDSLKDEYIQFLMDAAAIESPTDYKEGVDACGDFFIKAAKEKGFSVETEKMDVSGNPICITYNPNGKGKPICYSGHIDTVHPVGFFGNPPKIEIKDGFISGPGVSDCKGGVVIAFMAMDALSKVGYKDRPVKLIIQTDEENSSATSNKKTVEYMAKKAEGCEVLFNLEPTSPEYRSVLNRKGIAKYSFTVFGKSIHASQCYKPEAASAVTEAANKILHIEKLKDENGITANVGTITGGTATNTVPDSCSFTVDFRYSNDEELKTVENFVKEISEKSFVEGTSCEIKRNSLRLAMPKIKANYDILEKLNKIYSNIGLPVSSTAYSGGGSDAADFSAKGITVVDTFGIYGTGNHTPFEAANIDSMTVQAKRLASACILL